MTNFDKVGTFMKTFGQEVKTEPSFGTDKINKLIALGLGVGDSDSDSDSDDTHDKLDNLIKLISRN